jgi:hypothetical protein
MKGIKMDKLTKESFANYSKAIKSIGTDLGSEDLDVKDLKLFVKTLRTYAEILEFQFQKLNRS